MDIRVVYTEDSLFGGARPEDLARVDVPASMQHYEELLRERLQAEYPDAQITVEEGGWGYIEVDGQRDSEEVQWVAHFAEQLYQALDWWVER